MKRLLIAAALALAAIPADAQRFWPDPNGTGVMPGEVPACINAAGQAVPCGPNVPLPVVGMNGYGQTLGTPGVPTVVIVQQPLATCPPNPISRKSPAFC